MADRCSGASLFLCKIVKAAHSYTPLERNLVRKFLGSSWALFKNFKLPNPLLNLTNPDKKIGTKLLDVSILSIDYSWEKILLLYHSSGSLLRHSLLLFKVSELSWFSLISGLKNSRNEKIIYRIRLNTLCSTRIVLFCLSLCNHRSFIEHFLPFAQPRDQGIFSVPH